MGKVVGYVVGKAAMWAHASLSLSHFQTHSQPCDRPWPLPANPARLFSPKAIPSPSPPSYRQYSKLSCTPDTACCSFETRIFRDDSMPLSSSLCVCCGVFHCAIDPAVLRSPVQSCGSPIVCKQPYGTWSDQGAPFTVVWVLCPLSVWCNFITGICDTHQHLPHAWAPLTTYAPQARLVSPELEKLC